MTRYLEWTTASYLTNSIYGRCSSATSCTEVTINNSSSYITGNAGNSSSASGASGIFNAYHATAGQLASTTGNIYGIYDMSGRAVEYVMGVLEHINGRVFLGGKSSVYPFGFAGKYGDGGSASGGTELPERQYYDTFLSNSITTYNYSVLIKVNGSNNMNGGFKEMMGSNAAEYRTWYNDYAYFTSEGIPWFTFGGGFGNTAYSGVFHSSYTYGNVDTGHSFCVVMTIE